MLNNVDEIQEGQVVYLYPHTKTASRSCHRLLTVKVQEGKKHWPMVVVVWEEDGEHRWELVHKDNIKKRPVAPATRVDKREGDMARSEEAKAGKWARVRKLPGRPKPIALADNEEQGTLF